MDVGSIFMEVASKMPNQAKSTEEIAIEHFQTKYRELTAAIKNRESVGQKMYSFAKIHMIPHATGLIGVNDLVGQMELALLRLIERGAVTFVFDSLPGEAKNNFEELKQSLIKRGLIDPPVSQPTVAAAAVTKDNPLDLCATAFRDMPSSEFRRVWMSGANREIYDRAVIEGRI